MNNSTISFSEKYENLYFKNLVLGYQIGATNYLAPKISSPDKLQEEPFWNRVYEVGTYNVIQHSIFANTSGNVAYLGLFQTAKWFPNLIIQNYVKEITHFKPDESLAPVKSFFIAGLGMSSLFTVVALENNIESFSNKIAFLSSVIAPIAVGYVYSNKDCSISEYNSVNFSPIGALKASAGIAASFILPNIISYLELDKSTMLKLSIVGATAISTGGSAIPVAISALLASSIDPALDLLKLKDAKFLGYDVENILSLSFLTGAYISTDPMATNEVARIAGTTIAKATVVTATSAAVDHREYICSFAGIDKICEWLGNFAEVTT